MVAVSGGVDSMVLLELLANQPQLDIIVAHVDHGIRADSAADRRFVQQRALELSLPFKYQKLQLGGQASEQQAREARYTFLEQVRQQARAQAIVTAHHQDDIIETMLINLHRGTGRRGLSSLRSTTTIVRPLLFSTKNELRTYALEHAIEWREDSTNQQTNYLRNYLRLHILPNMSCDQRDQLLEMYQRMAEVNRELDELLENITLATEQDRSTVVRKEFVMLPHVIAQEYVAKWLRSYHVHNLSRKLIERIVASLKTAQSGTQFDIDGQWLLQVSQKTAQIVSRDIRKS